MTLWLEENNLVTTFLTRKLWKIRESLEENDCNYRKNNKHSNWTLLETNFEGKVGFWLTTWSRSKIFQSKFLFQIRDFYCKINIFGKSDAWEKSQIWSISPNFTPKRENLPVFERLHRLKPFWVLFVIKLFNRVKLKLMPTVYHLILQPDCKTIEFKVKLNLWRGFKIAKTEMTEAKKILDQNGGIDYGRVKNDVLPDKLTRPPFY